MSGKNMKLPKPLLFLILRSAPADTSADLAFANLAAEQGFQVLTAPIGDNNSLAARLAEAGSRRPASGDVVWMAGVGAAGQCAARFAVASIDRVSGLCLMAAQYYGADNTDWELAEMRGYRLPVLTVNGLDHANGLLPYNQDPRHPMAQRRPGITPSDFSLVAGYEEQRFWRRLNHGQIFELAAMAALDERSADVCERRIGSPFDRTRILTIDGVTHYIGDALDRQGQVMLRCVGVEGCADDVPGSAAFLLWSYRAETEAARQQPPRLEDLTKACITGDFWETPFAAIGGRTPKAVIAIGNQDYRFEHFIRGRFGENQRDLLRNWLLFNEDDLNPALVHDWRRQGLVKTLHRRPEPGRTWVSYVPVAAGQPRQNRLFPLVFLVSKGLPLMFLETFGFMQMAAKQELIVIAARDGNDDDNFISVIDEATRLYPVDRSRVFLAGHSFGASSAGRHAISFADRIAGVCLMACQYYGADSTLAEEIGATALGMPLIVIHGTCEIRSLLPLDVDTLVPMPPRNTFGVTTSTMSLISAYEEQRFWRGINGCAPISLEKMAGIHARSTDDCEKQLGIPVDRSEVQMIDGCRHYIGDLLDRAGRPRIRYIGVEGCPHVVPATAAQLAWAFWQRFSRDPDSKQLADTSGQEEIE